MRHLQLLFAVSSRAVVTKIRLMSHKSDISSGTNILAKSWSTISTEYEKVLVPRFAPWTHNTLDALRVAVNKDMKCVPDDIITPSRALVLCCGPGQELLPIARILGPTSTVLGIDLAPGMVDSARERIETECKDDDNIIYKECITAEVGDAMDPPPGPHHVIFSAFGLQQLPSPIQAIESWFNVMEPGGICVFIYWPPSPPKIPGEEDSPFHFWRELIKKKLGKQDKEDPWDENIDAAVAAAGGEIIEDKFISHDICWKDARDLFDGMSRVGPWHAMRLRRGDDFVDELGKELQSLYPAGTCLCHKFTARMVVARRRENQSKGSKI
eukprot:CAMPEP_0201898550 /NCGR_PEP_ID=MMETSP0902-20130614/48685_1 /ASSEMBLY_ACC=CAM_ASM_000551 /TAXON_ID=420261 /ORGANISM="Thalassiosira antarctica, Strain CCMP982" /LENGTH=325 /DNA_ID=CAMNT_0048431741 /DNA_START=191 /DNA_END=1168 /DNA_ORIENTATION=-